MTWVTHQGESPHRVASQHPAAALFRFRGPIRNRRSSAGCDTARGSRTRRFACVGLSSRGPQRAGSVTDGGLLQTSGLPNRASHRCGSGTPCDGGRAAPVLIGSMRVRRSELGPGFFLLSPPALFDSRLGLRGEEWTLAFVEQAWSGVRMDELRVLAPGAWAGVTRVEVGFRHGPPK